MKTDAAKLKEVEQEIIGLEDHIIKMHIARLEANKKHQADVAELKANIPPEGLIWITREEHKEYEQQQSDIIELAIELDMAAHDMIVYCSFGSNKKAKEAAKNYKEIANKHLDKQ